MMFFHVFCYQLKNFSREKYIIGWNLLFPLVLATAFYIGFGHMVTEDPNSFQTITAGYAEVQPVSGTPEEGTGSGNAEIFLKVLGQLQTEGGENLIGLTRYDSEKEAREALLDGQIEGYYLNEGGELSLHIREEGVNSTILSQILKQYRSACTMEKRIAENHPSRLLQTIAGLSVNREYLEEYTPGRQISPYLQFFFALLAMSSMYASWIATAMMESMCANLSECGKRFESSGAGRFPSILAGALAGTTFQIVSNAITVLYVEYVLRISFQAPFPEIMMIMGLGSAVGIGFGILFGTLFQGEALRVAIPLTFSMVSSFLSGLMMGQMKQLVENAVPVLNRINPAAVFTDSLYVLASYGKNRQYWLDVLSMVGMVIVTLSISAVILRRRRYASI